MTLVLGIPIFICTDGITQNSTIKQQQQSNNNKATTTKQQQQSNNNKATTTCNNRALTTPCQWRP
jgi:hypothetical protein